MHMRMCHQHTCTCIYRYSSNSWESNLMGVPAAKTMCTCTKVPMITSTYMYCKSSLSTGTCISVSTQYLY